MSALMFSKYPRSYIGSRCSQNFSVLGLLFSAIDQPLMRIPSLGSSLGK